MGLRIMNNDSLVSPFGIQSNYSTTIFNPREPWATPVLHDIKLVIKRISYKLG